MAIVSASCKTNDVTADSNDALRTVIWRSADSPAGVESDWLGSPQLVLGKVIVIRNLFVVALDAGDGHEVWRRAVARSGIHSPTSLLSDGVNVYAASGDSLFSIDVASGATRWVVPTNFDYAQCEGSIDASAVYLCSYTHQAAAFDRNSGTKIWETVLPPASALPARVSGSVLGGDTIYYTVRRDIVGGGEVLEVPALDRRSGNQLWVWTSPDTRTAGSGAPALSGRVLVINDQAGAIVGIDRFTQQLRWRIPNDPGSGPQGTPAIVGDTAYVASADGNGYAIHVLTGTVLWRTAGGGSYLSVGICGSKVFANDFGLDVRDRRSGLMLDRVLASRSDVDYALSGMVGDGIHLFVAGHAATYALRC
jgi:outer membrane protein assembly factor BamB